LHYPALDFSSRFIDPFKMIETTSDIHNEPHRDRVAHIADIHFWRVVRNPFRMLNKRFLGNLTVAFRRSKEFAMENAEAFADAVAATGVNAVVLTGDFTSTSLPEEFETAARFVLGLRDRGLQTHVLQGNHDVYTFEARRAKRFEKIFADLIPKEGYPALRFLPGGAPLLLVPTVCPRVISASGIVTKRDVDKVSSLLRECGPKAIVAAHYPVLHKTSGYESNRCRRLENADLLRNALIESDKRILYICGHVHRFSYERDREQPLVEYVSMGAFFRKNAKEKIDGEFGEIRVHDEGFSVFRHTHSASWRAEQARSAQ
jgi:3',5'-cyclic AMP phosphodiesterase CpdA